MEVSGRKEWDRNPSVTEGQVDIYCQPCRQDGETVPAEGFCETCNEYICTNCLKVHRKLAITKNHVIKTKDEMPRVNVQQDPCSELCRIHKAEIIKFYCKDHDSVGCGDCMVLDHKACMVKLVPDVSGNYASSTDFAQIKKNIDFLKSEISSHRNEIQADIKAADEMRENVVKEIKKFRKEINNYFDCTETALLKEVDELQQRHSSKFGQVQREFEDLEMTMKECQSKINQNSNAINQLFVTAKRTQKTLKKCNEQIKQLISQCEHVSCAFVPSKEIKALLENKCPIGKISMQARKFNTKSKKRLVDMETSFVKDLAVREGTEDNCFISGMAMISTDEILIVDFNNKSLKILNVNVNKITSKYKTPGRPWDATVIDSGSCAVTLMPEGKILFINTSNGISESHRLAVRKNCRGIDYRNGLLAVSFAYPALVQILDMKGTVLHNIGVTNVPNYPNYVTLSHDNQSLLLSDYTRTEVFEIDLDGQIKTTITYVGMRTPQGLTMTRGGTAVVCCEGNCNIVSMIVPSTRQILPLTVKGVKSPVSLAVCEDRGEMYIYDSSSEQIKVFALK